MDTTRLVATPPETVLDTGIRMNLLEDLALKILYLTGELSLAELGKRMRLHHGVIEEIFEHMRREQLCEVTGMVGGIHRIIATSKGKTKAHELLTRNMYSGPAPVSLSTYVEVVRAQSVRDVDVHRADVRKAFQHLVISDETLDQLGAALVSGRSIILYGPTGTGKTMIAETLPRIYRDAVWIPYAVEVEGQIITVFDAHTHERTEEGLPEDYDTRWVLCQRPRVVVGGELTMDLLDLQLNPATRFYTAPLQMKANNGILIVDDFGRQRVQPTELLNRWIVPLDRRIDYLALAGGNKFEIPFDVMVTFSTNLNPASLADEAFMRRIQTKVKVGYMSGEQFHEIARRVCEHFGLVYEPPVVDEFIRALFEIDQPLRACYPRDIIEHICWRARYEGKKAQVTAEAVREACASYFLAPQAECESN